jgi:hypothetical protein
MDRHSNFGDSLEYRPARQRSRQVGRREYRHRLTRRGQQIESEGPSAPNEIGQDRWRGGTPRFGGEREFGIGRPIYIRRR